MNITHVIFSMNTGGAELMLIDIMRQQVLLGHEVSLVVINNIYEQPLIDTIHPDVKVHFVGRPEGSRNPMWIVKYNMMLRMTRPDVVHFHLDGCIGITLFKKHIVNVYTVHSPGLILKNYKRLDKVFSISQAVKDDIQKRYGIDSEVVLNGIDFGKIQAHEGEKTLKNPFRIVQVGRIRVSIKGHDILLRAMGMLAREGYDVSADFIGETFDRGLLDDLARELGIEGRVNYLGLRSREYITSHLKDYDLLAQPSRYEGFGLTLVEGMGAKIPVLASNIEGPAEVLQHGKYGRLFETESPEDCAAAIKDIIDNYESYSELAHKDAYDYAVNEFSIRTTAKKYIKAYKSVCK